MSKLPTYRTERLNDSNLKDVRYLYQTIFKQAISLETLRLKYDTSYTGAKHLTYLAYDGDKPIAFYGALPQRMNHKGEEILGVHTCDSLTLPTYQRQGIHKMLGLKAYDLMRKNGVKFVYAFHSENTFYSCKKLDWDLAFTMRGFSVSTNSLPWGKVLRKIGVTRPYFESNALRVLRPYQISASEFKNSNSGLFQVYDERFFKYKSFTPNLIVEIENVRFWLKISGNISVGDVNFESESDLLRGIEKLKKLTSKVGLNEILFQTTPGTMLEQALSKHFESFESWKVGYYLFDRNIDIEALRGNYGDFDTF